MIPELKERIQYFEGDLFKYPGKMPLRTKEVFKKNKKYSNL